MVKRIPILACAALVLALSACQKSQDTGIEVTQGADGSKSVRAIGMTFQWRFEGESLEIHVTSPGKGWIGVGFDPRNLMREADFILLYVADGQAVAADQYGSQLTNHERDTALGGTDDVTVVSGSETDSGTEVTFRVPVNSGDEFDKVLTAGTEHTILLAYSEADDFETQHTPAARTKIKVTL
jgi:hypothetical protein